MSPVTQLVIASLIVIAIVAILAHAEKQRSKRAKASMADSYLDQRLAAVRQTHAAPPAKIVTADELDLDEQSRNLDAAVKAAREGMHSFT